MGVSVAVVFFIVFHVVFTAEEVFHFVIKLLHCVMIIRFVHGRILEGVFTGCRCIHGARKF